jgi:hypothetical protein
MCVQYRSENPDGAVGVFKAIAVVEFTYRKKPALT